MAEIVNFKRAKKAKARALKDDAAATNRARFGQPKAERDLTKARAEMDAERLDRARLDDAAPDGES